MDVLSTKYRYPGTSPFTKGDTSLFFGRDSDIRQLSEFILLEEQVVLYGKSGLGKTSLLNAGVIPKLEEEKFIVANIRFGAFTNTQAYSPLDILRQGLALETNYDNFLWKKVLEVSHESIQNPTKKEVDILETLYYYCKSAQIDKPKVQGFILVFDQFEELFTYPIDQIRRFKQSLTQLLNVRVPKYIRDTIKGKKKGFLNREELELLYRKPDIKVVYSIRSDKISLLNNLQDCFPSILQKNYELRSLTREQAQKAIVAPAQYKSSTGIQFITPAFQYENRLLKRMLDFLTKDNTKDVESFQLQVLCKYVESIVLVDNSYIKNAIPSSNYLATVQNQDVSDLSNIFKNYYKIQIKNLNCTEKESLRVRELMEEGLIFSEESSDDSYARRLSIFEGVIHSKYGVSPSLLAELEKTRLIRAEPHVDGGFLYEVSHDTLIEPIMEAYKERKQATKQEQENTKWGKERDKYASKGTSEIDDYLRERVKKQLEWYSKKSSENKQKYIQLKKAEVIIACSIPILVSFIGLGIFDKPSDANDIDWDKIFNIALQVVVAMAGISYVIINKILDLGQYYELWRKYRGVAESLQTELQLYKTAVGPYQGEGAFNEFVEKVEMLMSAERQRWLATRQNQKSKEKTPSQLKT